MCKFFVKVGLMFSCLVFAGCAGHSLKEAKEKNNIQAYEKVIEKYPDSPEAKEAASVVEKLEYDNTLKINNSNAYHSYLNRFPHGSYKLAAKERLKDVWCQELLNDQNIKEMEEYASYFKTGSCVDKILNLKHKLIYQDALSKDDDKSYEAYLYEYPQGPHANEIKSILDRRQAAREVVRVSRLSSLVSERVDVMALYNKLQSVDLIEKDEFETQSEYLSKKRKALENLSLKDEYVVSLPADTKYHADKEHWALNFEIALREGNRYYGGNEKLDRVKIPLLETNSKYTTYMASNSYGANVLVDKYTGYEYGLVSTNRSNIYKFKKMVDNQLHVRFFGETPWNEPARMFNFLNASLIIPMPLVEAKKIKDLESYLLFSLEYESVSTEVTSTEYQFEVATLDDPSAAHITENLIKAKLKSIIVSGPQGEFYKEIGL
tara:strand:- start:135 stop:1436 length:1302 start_codon:yes stop_codon:yes gene_type:complete